jgi:hypothetical protein
MIFWPDQNKLFFLKKKLCLYTDKGYNISFIIFIYLLPFYNIILLI